MIKKIIILTFTILLLNSCSLDDDRPNITVDTVPVKSQIVPSSFTYGTIDTIKVVYEIPDQCHSFYNLYYEYDGAARKIAINTLVNKDITCTQVVEEKEHSFLIHIRQREDYILKFWKGKDSIGNNVFTEIIVPVKRHNE